MQKLTKGMKIIHNEYKKNIIFFKIILIKKIISHRYSVTKTHNYEYIQKKYDFN